MNRRERISTRAHQPHGVRLDVVGRKSRARVRTLAFANGVGVSWWGGQRSGFRLSWTDDGIDESKFHVELSREVGLRMCASILMYAARHGGLSDFEEILAGAGQVQSDRSWSLRAFTDPRVFLEAPSLANIVEQIAAIYEREQRDAAPTYTIPHELGQAARAAIARTRS